MAQNSYRLCTRWLVDGTTAEVGAILRDTESIVRWWPSVFLDIKILVPATPECETGKVAICCTKGWMPHTLTFSSRVIDSWYPFGFVMEVWGDFEGQLHCWSEPCGDRLGVYNDWRVRVPKPFVRRFSWLLRPLFESNHRWVIARGEESLNLELRRRRAEARGEELTERPPAPTFPHGPLSTYFRRRTWMFAPLLDDVSQDVSERERAEADGDAGAAHHNQGAVTSRQPLFVKGQTQSQRN